LKIILYYEADADATQYVRKENSPDEYLRGEILIKQQGTFIQHPAAKEIRYLLSVERLSIIPGKLSSICPFYIKLH